MVNPLTTRYDRAFRRFVCVGLVVRDDDEPDVLLSLLTGSAFYHAVCNYHHDSQYY